MSYEFFIGLRKVRTLTPVQTLTQTDTPVKHGCDLLPYRQVVRTALRTVRT